MPDTIAEALPGGDDSQCAGDDARTAPLTYHQERIWFIEEFERGRVYPGSPTYHNIPVLLRIDGTADATALEAALNGVVARHEALRTNVRSGRQHVRARAHLTLEVVDASPAGDEEAIAAALAGCLRPFRLDEDLPCRAALYRLAAPIPNSHLSTPTDASGGDVPGVDLETENRSVLALTVHHLVADLRSIGILVEDLVALYGSRVGGGDVTLPPAGEFSRYAAWQRALPDSAFEQALTFWKWQLQDGAAPLELPCSRPRHRIHVFAPAACRFELGADLVAALAALGERERAGLHDVVLAAFVAVLHACSRQAQILVGTSHANRDGPLERMVGPIANLLVLRFDADGAQPFRQLLRHVQRTVRQAAINRAVPFDRLVQTLNPPRDMSRTALFDVLYQFLDPEPRVWHVPGAVVTRLEAAGGFGKYDLNLTLRPDGPKLAACLEYNAELFHPDFIGDLQGLFEATLRSVTEADSVPLERHLTLPPAQASRQAALAGARPGPQPVHATLDAAFDAVARQSPDRIAIVCDGAHLSYRALAARANQVGRALLAAGVRAGTPVAVFLDRSPDALGAILGILRAGAAYVPVDPAYPPLRVTMLLEDSNAGVVVTTAALATRLDAHAAGGAIRLVEIDGCSSLSGAPLGSRSAPDDVAYSIYTSGSTGRPKGCLVTHRNVVQLILGQAAAFRFGAHDTWTWSHSFCFDFSVWEIFGTLLHGGRGVLLSEDALRDPAMVQQALEREDVSVLNQTPVAGCRLLERLLDRDARIPSLRWLVFGGDLLSPKQVAAWSRRNPNVAIVNMYGITETTVHVTFKQLAAGDLANDSRSVGRALPNAATWILGARLDLIPLGVVGEIGVTGQGVSLGYWKRPDLTAERFVPDPFGSEPGARMYLSGDTGRLLPDGEVEFHGRRDDQVKIRGYRVELGEIEAALSGHPHVAEAAAVAREEPSGDRMLVAFVVPSQPEIDVAVLRAHLQERLTRGLLPHAIQPVGALPRTATGKVDRKALAHVAVTPAPARRGYVAPRNDRERTLVAAWEEVLGRSPIGVADDFFEAGGDSILSLQICARATRAGIPLTPRQLFEHPTIDALCRNVEPVRPEAAAPPVVTRAPLLPAQAWFFAQRHAAPNHFNQSAWFELPPGTTCDEITAALGRLRARHDALRLVFVREDGRIWQEAREPAADVPLVRIARDAERPRDANRRIAAAVDEAQRGLDVHTGPLFGGVFVEGAAAVRPRLLLICHHLIVDSASWRILADDLDLLLEPSASTLPAAGSLLRCALQDAAAPAPAPDDEAALEGNTFEHYAEMEASLEADATDAIANLLAAEKLSWEDALVAGASQAVFDSSRRDSADLFFESHGRDLAADDSVRTVGWFMKLYRVSLERSVATPLERVKAARTSVLRAKRGPDLLAGAQPFAPGLCVNFLGQVDALLRGTRRLTLSRGEMGSAIDPRNRRPHLVDVNARIQDGALRICWGYSGRIHEAGEIDRLASRCLSFLRSLAAAGDACESYPLAPGQLGIFYHALLGGGQSSEYVIRSVLEVEGPFDADAFRASWAFLLRRHEALRAWFSWDGPEGPRQHFADRVQLRSTEHDWSDVEPGGRLEALVREAAGAGLDLSTPPLLSVDIVRTAARNRSYVLLQIHHLVIDGWSLAILRRELMRVYAALLEGGEVRLPPAGRFRGFLGYLAHQSADAARDFWRRRLDGASACLMAGASGDVADVPASIESVSLDAIDRLLTPGTGLAGWAARHRLTLNTIVQGAWSLVLGCMTRRADVVAGAVVAGRPAALPDVEATVGPFINTVPLRATLQAQERFPSWCQELQRGFVEIEPYAHAPLADVYAWAGLSRDEPLFDTVLVCQSYPTADAPPVRGLAIREVTYSLKESVPVVVEYSFVERLICRFRYRPDLASSAIVARAAELLRTVIDAIDGDGDLRVGDIASMLAERDAAWQQARTCELAAVRRRLLRGVATRGASSEGPPTSAAPRDA